MDWKFDVRESQNAMIACIIPDPKRGEIVSAITHESTLTVARRPGRKLGAERRRIARSVLREFYADVQFQELPRKVQLAILELCPECD